MHDTIHAGRTGLDPATFSDWRRDHRDLPASGREQAVRYIDAIVARDPFVTGNDDLARSLARNLFIRFRTAFDELRGPFAKSDSEDVARALSRI